MRGYLPKDTGDLVAFVFINFAFLSIVFYEIIHVLPTVDQGSSVSFAIHLALAAFSLTNIYGNFAKLVSTDSSTKGLVLPSVLREGWRLCYECEANTPPRAYHCHSCRRCILRQDHHCVFAGTCVGHKNYRYFLMLLFHMSWTGIYLNIINFEFTLDILGGFQITTLLAMLLPWLAWLMGVHGPFTFVVAFMGSMVLFGTMFCVSYFVWQLNAVLSGRTSHEVSKGISMEYNIGRLANIKQVLGHNWKLCWLSPFITSDLYTDGTIFPTRGSFEQVKGL